MKRSAIKLKKTLTKDRVFEVLEIVGLSPVPLSAYKISMRWGKDYSPDRNLAQQNGNYIYEVIKRIYKPGEYGHPEKLLAISYKENVRGN